MHVAWRVFLQRVYSRPSFLIFATSDTFVPSCGVYDELPFLFSLSSRWLLPFALMNFLLSRFFCACSASVCYRHSCLHLTRSVSTTVTSVASAFNLGMQSLDVSTAANCVATCIFHWCNDAELHSFDTHASVPSLKYKYTAIVRRRHHSINHTRDVGFHTRNVLFHTRDVRFHTRDVRFHTRNVRFHTRDVRFHTRDIRVDGPNVTAARFPTIWIELYAGPVRFKQLWMLADSLQNSSRTIFPGWPTQSSFSPVCCPPSVRETASYAVRKFRKSTAKIYFLGHFAPVSQFVIRNETNIQNTYDEVWIQKLLSFLRPTGRCYSPSGRPSIMGQLKTLPEPKISIPKLRVMNLNIYWTIETIYWNRLNESKSQWRHNDVITFSN